MILQIYGHHKLNNKLDFRKIMMMVFSILVLMILHIILNKFMEDILKEIIITIQ